MAVSEIRYTESGCSTMASRALSAFASRHRRSLTQCATENNKSQRKQEPLLVWSLAIIESH